MSYKKLYMSLAGCSTSCFHNVPLQVLQLLLHILLALLCMSTWLLNLDIFANKVLIMAEFNFIEWCKSSQLLEKTVDLLKEKDLTTNVALMAWLEMEGNDLSVEIASWDLSLGQRCLLKKALSTMNGVVVPADPKQVDTIKAEGMNGPPISTKVLSKDKDLNELIREMESSSDLTQTLLLEGVLANGAKSSSSGYQYSPDYEKKGKKTMYIKDFLDDMEQNEDAETEIFSKDGQTLYLKSKHKKVETENVTPVQWTYGNAKIMKVMITQGELDTSTMQDYLDYTSQIADYMAKYPQKNVMKYDKYVREQMSTGKMTKWGGTDPTVHGMLSLLSAHVVDKTTTSDEKREVGSKSASSGRKTFTFPCRDYNADGGCKRPQCRFQHVCKLEGCGGKHTQMSHHTVGSSRPFGSKE